MNKRERIRQLERAEDAMMRAAHALVSGQAGAKAMGQLEAALYNVRKIIQALKARK